MTTDPAHARLELLLMDSAWPVAAHAARELGHGSDDPEFLMGAFYGLTLDPPIGWPDEGPSYAATVARDAERTARFAAEAPAGVTYQAIGELTGKGIATVKRAAGRGNLVRVSPGSPARFSARSVLRWAFGRIDLPAATLDRERVLLWRILFTPGSQLPRRLPAFHDPARFDSLNMDLPPVHLPIPDSLRAVLDEFSACELRLLQGALLAWAHKTGDDLEVEYTVLRWAVAVAGANPGMGISTVFDAVEFNGYVCTECARPGFGHIGRHLARRRDDPDQPVELRCPGCGRRWTVTRQDLQDGRAVARSTYHSLDVTVPVEQQMTDGQYNAFLRGRRRQRRARSGAYAMVGYRDLSAALSTSYVGARNAWVGAQDRGRGIGIDGAANLLVWVRRVIDTADPLIRFSLPTVVSTLVDAQARRWVPSTRTAGPAIRP